MKGRSQAPTQAAAGHRDLLARRNHRRVGLELLEPRFHVADLAYGEAEVVDQ